MQIVDLPPVKNFPKNSLEEWNTCKGYGLRQATAFILVFDVSNPETFTTVKRLHDQILAGRHAGGKASATEKDCADLPAILLAGNKQDLLTDFHVRKTREKILLESAALDLFILQVNNSPSNIAVSSNIYRQNSTAHALQGIQAAHHAEKVFSLFCVLSFFLPSFFFHESFEASCFTKNITKL